MLGEGVHVQGPEHFVESHTRWGCAATPLTDPWSGRTLGVLDVSGPSRGMHPAELALVEAVARLTSLEIVTRRRTELDGLRARAAPILARMRGDVLAVDAYGHLAAAVGSRAPDRVALPDDLAAGEVWLPTLGRATAEPLAGGWLLRLDDDAVPRATRAVLDLTGLPCLRVESPSGGWSRRISPRHAEILLALCLAGPTGRTASDLAGDLFDDPTRTVTVRAEMSRLRRMAGSLLLSNPYRFSPGVQVTTDLPGRSRRGARRARAHPSYAASAEPSDRLPPHVTRITGYDRCASVPVRGARGRVPGSGAASREKGGDRDGRQ